MTNVTNDWDIRADHFVDRGWINVDMRLFRFRAERVQTTCNTVIKARANVDHQVTIMHGPVGLIKTVHAQHTQPRFARRRITA